MTLNQGETGKNPESITLNKYEWERINFPLEKNDFKKFVKKNETIAFNNLNAKKDKIYPTYVSKNNSNREKQVILLMIPIGKRWNYLAVKKLSALLRRITSKNYGDFYCLSRLHSFRTKSKLESHKNVCENKVFCNVIMPSEDTKMLRFNQ